jgi:hypothetical protein
MFGSPHSQALTGDRWGGTFNPRQFLGLEPKMRDAVTAAAQGAIAWEEWQRTGMAKAVDIELPFVAERGSEAAVQ